MVSIDVIFSPLIKPCAAPETQIPSVCAKVSVEPSSMRW